MGIKATTHPLPRPYNYHFFRIRSSQTTPRAPDPSSQLDILLHYRNPLGVNGAQIAVFEQMHHERFGGLLERLYGLALPAQGVAADGDLREADFADLGLR